MVGTPSDEPWHMTAHLADESRLAEIPELEPTLVRWAPPADAPAHLRVSIDRLRAATRDETLLVVSPAAVPDELLERINDVRRTGATILALDRGDPELGRAGPRGAGRAGGDRRRCPSTPPSTWSARRPASPAARGRSATGACWRR